jgi:UDP:flavonoid glycosyltransferase YjiC (YdhE family)
MIERTPSGDPSISTTELVKLTDRPRHFLLISFGTRGDVQPYIAMCVILQRRGHRCRIATHTDFRPWIESYRLEFRTLGGSGKAVRDLMGALTKHGFANPQNLLVARDLVKFVRQVYEDAYRAAMDEEGGRCDVDVILGVKY